ncbi:hypothetical protein CLAVI_000783 [Candidatus Clavichlamydia salmonicola]|uniref:SpoIID/LytB domain-containing protein n=1 Tax=Candidatus Clavichlamydia salmonicola TaxID=469812 RepID=UPI00189119A6|nr:SpoIID/LytB domain-containing protein [Candidatus Clavichlamydia salmonicola]MBF5051147.1 hypothetical protein [Candidatus Clavichlamydia salmonicola]
MNRYPWKYLLLIMMICTPLVEARIGSLQIRQEEIEQVSLMPEVKVLLHENVTSVLLESKDSYTVTDSRGTLLSSQSFGKRFVVHSMTDGLRWGEIFPAVSSITITPQQDDSYVFVNGMQYSGVVHVYRVDNHRITVVNELSVDDYLKSSLALKFDQSFSQEALSAYVIAERTKLVEKIKATQGRDLCWHLVSSDEHYLGYAITRRENGVDLAVDWTACMILDRLNTRVALDITVLRLEDMEALAQAGMNAKQILDAFYPDIKLIVLKTDFGLNSSAIG